MLKRRNIFSVLQFRPMKRLFRQARTLTWGGTGSQLLFSVLLLTNVVSALAQEVTSVFVPPSKPVTAGSWGSLWLYCINNSSNEVSRTFEPSLNGTLTSKSGSSETVLLLNTNSSVIQAAIAPGSFVKVEYLLDIPPTNNGQVTLAVSNYNQVMILVEQASTGVPAAPQPPPTSALTKTAPEPELREYFGSHMSYYEPIYFILGTYPAAEFQFSLKYKLLDLKDNWNPLTRFYFAYTQTSFWDLLSQDPSFYDTSYKPSGFFYYPDVLHKDFFQLDLQLGGEHESNGRGGSMERSLNTVYLQPTATFDLPGNLQLTLQPRAWFYVFVGGNNPDIADYRGYADLRTALTWTNADSKEKIQLATKLRIGDEGAHAGLQFDLRFNLKGMPLLHKFNPAIQVQYFTGYGQTLRQYDEASRDLRAGLCLWY